MPTLDSRSSQSSQKVVLPYPSFLSWFASRGYLQGVFWITLVALTSNLNDILMRLIGSRLPAMEIAFFRFLLSTLSLLPVMLYYGPSSFYTKRPWIHLCRAVLLFGAITCWVTGVTMVPLVTVSTLALTTQLFVLPMAAVFLNEKVGWQRVLATLLGFIGVCIIVCAESKDQALFSSLFSFNNGTLFLLAASMMFAFSDILNKKFVSQESTLSMMFYIALGTTMFGVIPAYSVWQPPTLAELILLGLLGVGGNLILFFLLRAFAATDVSALSPFRYSELFIAGITGFFIFQEVPSLWNLVGAAIIVPSTFALVRYETRQSRQHQQQGQRYAHSNLLEELT